MTRKGKPDLYIHDLRGNTRGQNTSTFEHTGTISWAMAKVIEQPRNFMFSTAGLIVDLQRAWTVYYTDYLGSLYIVLLDGACPVGRVPTD
jgi:hypothetical protein